MSEAIRFPETRAKATELLTDRYMASWNEPEPEADRRQMTAELWTKDGSRILQPPQEMRESAAGQGHSELQARATMSYEHWVGCEGLSFRAREDAERLGDVVKFLWEPGADDGSTAAVGLNVRVLAADGRVQRNSTFVDGA